MGVGLVNGLSMAYGASMDSFIETRGEASLIEGVVEYNADLSVTVRAAQVETALTEVEELRNRCIRGLREAGLGDSELKEGAGEVWRPWFWKKKAGQEVSRKILITCSDANRLYRALAALEPLFASQRYVLSVSMRAPRFDAAPERRASVQAAAVDDARSKAEVVARAAGIALGPVLQIEEIEDRVGRSGAYGDEDWRGFAAGGMAAAAEEGPEIIEGATRTRTVRFRVRFSLAGGATAS
jgi:uncharacterized protein YggE